MMWRDGACLDDTAPGHTPSVDLEDIDLDDLAAPAESPICSISRLAAEKATSIDSSRFQRLFDALATQDTQTLILRIESASDPLLLWEIHRELDGRGIEPCLRWPQNNSSAQMRLVTVMADLYWFTTRHPDHTPAFVNWQGLFKLPPGSDAWLDKAFYLWRNMPKDNLSRYGAKALALPPAHRQVLMMFPTATMVNRQRRQLEADRFAEIRATIYSAAEANKYKSRTCKTEALANHRARLWRVFVLLDSSPEATAKAWGRLTGETLIRQTVSKQIAIVKTALKKPRVLR